MSQKPQDPIRPPDQEAFEVVDRLMSGAKSAVLAFCLPASGAPSISRIGFRALSGGGLSLISTLSAHTVALGHDPRAALLLGDPGPKGDPLAHPRLTLHLTARFSDHEAAERPRLCDLWLETHPKSKLYIDFADFRFVRFDWSEGFLNGGFGRAYRLSADDLNRITADYPSAP